MLSHALLLALTPLVMATGYQSNFDGAVLADAPGRDNLDEGTGKTLPENYRGLDYSYAYAVNLNKGLIPSLVRPNTGSNVLISPARSKSELAVSIFRSEKLDTKYSINFKSVYFACAENLQALGAATPLDCTVEFDDGKVKVKATSPGTGVMTKVELGFVGVTSMTARIVSFGVFADLLVDNADLYLDSLLYAINPDPKPAIE